jgi:hypothetical protein
MPDHAGLLQRLVLSRTLWLIIAWPAAGFAWQVLVARPRIARANDPRAQLVSARNAAISFLALAGVSTAAQGVVLARTPPGAHALLQHIAPGARFGQLDAGFDLWFDPLSAAFCVLACLLAFAASGSAVLMRDGWRSWAWLQLSLAGALVAFLADGFLGTAMGWGLASAAAAWLAGWETASTARAVRCALAVWLMIAGAALLFWGQGGSWDGEDYAPDLQPRFAALRVERDKVASPSTSGWLTMTGAPGAQVFLDDARTASLRAPFVAVPVSAGAHSLRVRSADGANEEVLAHVAVGAASEVALVPLGPSLTFRTIADQLATAEGEARSERDTGAPRPLVDAPAAGPGGTVMGSVAVSLLLMVLAAWAMSGSPIVTIATAGDGGPTRTLAAVSCGATTALLGPFLLTRVAFLFPLAPRTWVAVESVGAVTLLSAGWTAPVYSGLRRWLVFVGAAPAALSWLALGAGGVRAAAFVAVATGAATGAFFLVSAHVSARASVRAPAGAPRGPAQAWGPRAARREAPGAFDAALFVTLPERLGTLVVNMDRFVVGAIVDAVAAFLRASAWAVAAADERLMSAPARALAARAVRLERAWQPLAGAPLGRLVWALLGAAALVALVSAFWPAQ